MKKSVSILMIGVLLLTLVVGSLPVIAQDDPQEPVVDTTPAAESVKTIYLPLIAGGPGNGSAEELLPEMFTIAAAVVGEEVAPLTAEKAADVQDDTSAGQVPPAPGLEPAQNASSEAEKVNVVEEMAEAAAVDGWVTIKSEGFEGAFPNTGWRVFDSNGATNGEYYWDDTSYTRYAGSWSAWPAKGGANGLNPSTYNYANNMRSWMIYGPFSLSEASEANLQFYYRNQSEANYDYFQWLASVDGTNFYGYQTAGDSNGWRSVTFDLKSVPTLGNLMGRSSVWIAFYFVSDGSVTQKGPFVDSITLQKLVNTSVNCPNQYKAEYFNNRTLSGSPAVTRCENWPINQNWGSGSPVSGVGSDNFSVRWTGTANINAGAYTFRATADDGIRVWLDNQLIIDAWRDQGPTTYEVNRTVSNGSHSIKVEYYENGGGAVAQFAWSPASVTCSNQYKAEYFNNRTLSGTPVVTRCENWPINYNWGGGSPVDGVGSDNFSVRWTGTAAINAGTYNFVAVADDGIRVWLDNSLIIDAWRDQGPTEYRVNRSVSSGNHTIKVEYYENGGGATAAFRWEATTTKKVVLDPGHGWCSGTPGPNCTIAPGAVGNNMKEKDVVLDIAQRTKALLEARGVQVFMTRTGDDPYHTLSYASQFVNNIAPDLSISIHANAGGGTGTEACYQDYKSTTVQSKDISTRMTNEIASRLTLNNRGIFSEYNSGRCGKGDQLYIHDMNPTAALIETAFIDTTSDATKLRDRRQDFAQAIANAILAYLGL
jgi:N-acetylmuramoyl-L-alanine amidase